MELSSAAATDYFRSLSLTTPQFSLKYFFLVKKTLLLFKK